MNELRDIAIINSHQDLGAMARRARENMGASLRSITDKSSFGTRFLSEFERGKPTAEIGKVIEALHAAGLDIAIIPRKKKPPTPPISHKLNLEFPYDWSNPNMSDSALIISVLEKARFNDVLSIAHHYGIERIETKVKNNTKGHTTKILDKYLSRIKKGILLANTQIG